MEAPPAADNGVLSAPLTAIPAYLRAREPPTSPAQPLSKPDPPTTPYTDNLHSLPVVRASPDNSGTPTNLTGCIEESAQCHHDLWVRDSTAMSETEWHVRSLDPNVGAVQLAHT